MLNLKYKPNISEMHACANNNLMQEAWHANKMKLNKGMHNPNNQDCHQGTIDNLSNKTNKHDTSSIYFC